ncbi:acyltransferase [Chryseobacterium manosquense]|uniref:Acyltransferase n=1 Tax=Chryseobacterium manosquense TaxID=2754694 RepID=A0A7H1DWF7_9FLAO|nr:acyltransferase [Chryseobacterium manosquense]QNS41315.1 acyltransferase [Chryseobacterium manosquense]
MTYKLKLFLVHLRLYFYNSFVARIPFNGIRMFFVRRYMLVGENSFVSMNVKLLNIKPKKSQVQIGKNSIINPGVLLDGREGKVIIGNNVDIARDTYIFTAQHDQHSDYHEIKSGNVIIEDYAWITARCTILPGVTIARGTVVATGSVVTKNTEEMSIVGGIPAKKIGVRRSKLLYTIDYHPYFYN